MDRLTHLEAELVRMQLLRDNLVRFGSSYSITPAHADEVIAKLKVKIQLEKEIDEK